MSKNRVRTAAAAGLACLPALFATTSAAQAKPSCNPAHSKTIVSNTFARVYGKKGKAFVCLRATGKSTLLKGGKPSCHKSDPGAECDVFALGGKWVAWTRGNPNDVDVTGGIVTVMNIRTRSVNHRWYPTASQGGEVYKIVVLTDGAAAWTESVSDGGGGAFAVAVFGTDRKQHSIDRLDSCGASVSHTASCYIDASSLRVVQPKSVGWKYSLDGSHPPTLSATHSMY